jgi:hypothetical protein
MIPTIPATPADAFRAAASALAASFPPSAGPPVETRSYKGVEYRIQVGRDGQWYARCGAGGGMGVSRESLIELVEYAIDNGEY